MSDQNQLNQDALEAAFDAVEHPAATRSDMEDIVSDAVSAYLAVAQPVVNRVAEIEGKHRREWADYIENWHATVGAPMCHVDAVVQALRSDRVPFGKGTSDGR